MILQKHVENIRKCRTLEDMDKERARFNDLSEIILSYGHLIEMEKRDRVLGIG